MSKEKIKITLKPIMFFPKMVGGIELAHAADPKVPSVIIIHAGSPIAVAEISAKGDLDKSAALMVLNHVTKKIAGSVMSAPPITGMVHGDSIPMTSEMMMSGIEAAFPDFEFIFDKSW